MGDDDWVKVARVDDAVVAELLLRLKGVNMIAAQPPTTTSTPKQALLIEWRVRQRRSKAVSVQAPKDQAPRDSPSTPLSFCGGGGGAMSVSFGGGIGSGASGSGGGGLDSGPEEESIALSAPKTSSMSRSKVIRSCESNTIRKSKKKKLQTLIELKAEDEFLARERLQLQKELESVRYNLEKERARNVKLKKIKLQHMGFVQSDPNNTLQTVVAEDAVILQHSFSLTGCSEPKIEEPVIEFVLPDLNLPLEENC